MPQRPAFDPQRRLDSLDAYRGFTMLLMVSSGFGLDAVARQFPDSSVWTFVAYHFSHAAWRGGGLWDMIQPSFTFMVGVAAAFSFAHRAEAGETRAALHAHAARRAAILVALGVLLRSRWTFEDVLAQIGLGYFFVAVLWRRPTAVIAGAAGAILAGYWALFALWPLAPPDYDWASVGVSAEWLRSEGFTGFAAHWNINANPAHRFDVWLLNLLPHDAAFTHNSGGYQTLSAIPSLATMLLGLLAGEALRSDRTRGAKSARLVVWGLIAVAAGIAADRTGVCPIVKRIWTPSWTLYSAGWSLLTLALLNGLIDAGGLRAWAHPGIVAGRNSIAIYVMAKLLPGWIDRTTRGLCGEQVYKIFNSAAEAGTPALEYDPIVRNLVVVLVLWCIAWRMHLRRVYVRI